MRVLIWTAAYNGLILRGTGAGNLHHEERGKGLLLSLALASVCPTVRSRQDRPLSPADGRSLRSHHGRWGRLSWRRHGPLPLRREDVSEQESFLESSVGLDRRHHRERAQQHGQQHDCQFEIHDVMVSLVTCWYDGVSRDGCKSHWSPDEICDCNLYAT